jgi:hypothetical protein
LSPLFHLVEVSQLKTRGYNRMRRLELPLQMAGSFASERGCETRGADSLRFVLGGIGGFERLPIS